MGQFSLDANGNFKIVLLFEGTNNDPQNNPSAISELKYAYDWIYANSKGERLDEGQMEKLKRERENKKSDYVVMPPEYRIYRKRELNNRERLVNDSSRGQVVHLTTGSGTHGVTLADVTGADWKEILKEQYEFLKSKVKIVQENLGDQFDISKIHLYVFGFSRGAYQAKLFANGICRYGIDDSGDEFIRKVKDDDKSCLKICREGVPTIDYLGLIDTVAAWDSVSGVVGKKYAPKDWACVGIPDTVRKCRHAVALNEYRPRFEPQLLHPDAGDSRIEELCFVGAHSDVGWAYNGQLDKAIKPGEPNEIPTRTFGKMVLTWLIEPVSDELLIENRDGLLLNYKTTIDYIKLLATFPFIFHDSYLDKTNILLPGQRRSGLDRVNPHSSLSVLRYMVDSKYFPSDDEEIKVVKAQYEGKGWFRAICDLKRDVKEVPLVGCYKDLLGIIYQGDAVYVPFIKAGTDTAGRIIKKVFRKVVKAFWKESAFREIYAYGKENLKLDLMEPKEERKKFKSYCDCRLLCNVISELEDEIKRGFI